ncbi:MAG: porphobilinogen deaminase [Sulfurovum sp. PC08-66]|nr:MAG: porphobilinogen deaminase [Sulfurovum sp. PC08-66]KIM12371.1 MAG: porphobilinogen deaminase [Sulfuricurvum sp. PC08-66]
MALHQLIIATRGSKLALWQSEHIKAHLLELYPHLEVTLNVIVTKGDKILDTPLALIGGKGLFTKEIDEAMLAGEAHISVNSLKDVPVELPAGIVMAAVTTREDVRDMMLSEKYASIEELPKGAIIGTTSLRRRMMLLAMRPDLTIHDLRGNVDTRIQKLKNGEFDAIILASAGINRLGLNEAVTYATPIEMLFSIPSMGQGALAINAIDEPEILALLAPLDDAIARAETQIEREFVAALEGGCQVPIGINATVLENDDILVKSVLGLPNGRDLMRQTKVVKRGKHAGFGTLMAQELIDRGAKELLAQASAIAFKE